MVVTVYLIRHAETDFNKENSGFSQAKHIELNSQGLIQLQDLRRVISRINFDTIYSSSLARAKQTARALFDDKSIISDDKLNEYLHGEFSPDSKEWKDEYNRLLKEGFSREEIRPFGGENIWDLIKRANSFLRELEKLNGNIAAISHSGFNETLINLSQNRKKEDFMKIKQDNACINILRYENNQWNLLSINDTEHLNNLKPALEYYENIEIIDTKLKEFIKDNLDLSNNEIYAVGDLSINKVGKYSRVFRRYSGTPLEIATNLVNNISKEWKLVCLLKDRTEYEIGKIKLNNVEYKINLIIPKDYEKFVLSHKLRKINLAKMKEKILLFVYNPKIGKFLLLNNSGKKGKFVINEIISEGESSEAFAKRKLKEETGLNAVEILPLEWGSVYIEESNEFKEMNFIAFTDSDKISLNKKYSAYEWLSLEDFIRNIKWEDNKELLKIVLAKGINKEIYFNKKERGQ